MGKISVDNQGWKRHFPVLGNLICAMGSSMLLNFTLQFFLYPAIEREVGEVRYGEILMFITLANVCGLSFGGAANSTFLTSRRFFHAKTGDSFCVLAWISIVISVISIVLFHNYFIGVWEVFGVVLLIILTIFRCYSFLDFQLKRDYVHYLLFMIIVTSVNVACLPLFYLTKWWPFILLPGQAMGILYVAIRGQIYRNVTERSKYFSQITKDTLTLSGAQLLNYGAQNVDRFLLLPLLGGRAVTYYYIASLLGKTFSMLTGPINNLILGYMSDGKVPLNRKIFGKINFLILTISVVLIMGVILVSPLILSLPFLYPEQLDAIRRFIPLASVAQILVISSSIVVTIDLLVAPKRMQLYLQGIYIVVYIILSCVFITYGGLYGFCIAGCIAALIRYLISAAIGWYFIETNKKS